MKPLSEGAMRTTAVIATVICSALLLPRAAAQVPDHTGEVPTPAPRRLVRDSTAIAVLQVAKVDRVADIITFKKVADIKGKHPEDELRHSLVGSDDRAALCEWARPGRKAVFFSFGHQAAHLFGQPLELQLGLRRAERRQEHGELGHSFEQTYMGPVEGLSKAVADILAGKEVVITAAAPVRERLYDDEQTPIVRDWLHGQKGSVRRIRASLKLSDDKAIEAAGERYVVGRGVGGKEAVPRLAAALKHDDACVRAEAAEDLGQIGAEAKSLSALRKAWTMRMASCASPLPRHVAHRPRQQGDVAGAAQGDEQQAGRGACPGHRRTGRGWAAGHPASQGVLREDGDAHTRAVAPSRWGV